MHLHELMTADLGHQLSWDRGKAIANVRTQTRLLAGGSLRNSQVRAGASDGHRGDVALLSFGGRVGGVDLAEGVGRRDAILETCVCVLGGGGGGYRANNITRLCGTRPADVGDPVRRAGVRQCCNPVPIRCARTRHGARAVVGPVPATEPRPAGYVRRRVLAGNSSSPVGNRTVCVRVTNYSPPLASWLAWSCVTRGESWLTIGPRCSSIATRTMALTWGSRPAPSRFSSRLVSGLIDIAGCLEVGTDDISGNERCLLNQAV